MSIESDLQDFISTGVVLGETDEKVAPDEPLMSSGRVDSLGLLQIIGFLRKEYDVDVLADGSPDDFETIASLAAAVRRAREPEGGTDPT